MCYPCQCPRRSISCHGGDPCCPRPCSRERSCSVGNCCRERSCFVGNCCRERSCSAGNNRVIFPGEFQKFSDMIPPSFLLKQPEDQKAKKKPCSAVKAAKADSNDQCEPEGLPCEPGPGLQCIPDQCTPCYAICYPPENQMTINMCPQPQWICFACPCAVCSPMATPIDPQSLPPAGVPTKRCPPFNPCTGQIYQCENMQMMVENPQPQCPTYNQNCQGVKICYGPGNPCPQFNPSNFGEGPKTNVPNQAYYQPYQGPSMAPASASPYYPYNGGDGTNQVPQEYSATGEVSQGDKRSNSKRSGNDKRAGNIARATGSRKDPNANQRQQYNQFSYVEGANQDQAYYQFCQGVNMAPGPTNPYYPYNGGDGQSAGSPERNPQGDNRSKSQRKGNETRSNNQNQYNHQNRREESMDRRRDTQAKQSGRVPQQISAVGQSVSQGGYISKSRTRENESRVDPRSQSQYNSHNLTKEPRDPRQSSRANSPGNQPTRSSYRSQSQEPRNESRRENSARSPQPSRSGTIRSDRDARSKSLGKRTESRENRSGNKPESNLRFYQQNMGMSFGTSNQEYVADCPLPDPIYTTQLESTLGDSGSSRQRRGSLPKYQATRGAPLDRPNKNCCLRFNPNNQYMSYECCCPPSPENSRSPREKSSHHARASNEHSQPLNRSKKSGSLDGHQMSTRTSKSRTASPAKKDVCKKCNRSKPNRQPTLAEILAKEASEQPCNRTLAEILANEVSEQPHVLMLETNKGVPNQEDPKKITPKKPVSRAKADPKDKCDCDSQDQGGSVSKDPCDCSCDCDSQNEVSSTESQDTCNASVTATENGEENPNCDATKNCWIRCPNPWLYCYGLCNGPCNAPCNGPCNGPCSGPCGGPCNGPCSGPCNNLCTGPCNGRFFYCGNCYNGCRKCCYYNYNPCGAYCCSQPPTEMPKPVQKAPPKPKEKKGGGRGTTNRKKGGVSMSNPSCCMLKPTPIPSFSIAGRNTMPGYYPTEHPQYISPYSGHWQAREVACNRTFDNQNR